MARLRKTPRPEARSAESARRGSHPVPRALVSHFAAHNRQVILLAVVALGGAVAFWALIYGVVYGVFLFIANISGNAGAHVTPLFTEGFIVSAVDLCGLLLIAQYVGPSRRLPPDNKHLGEHAADVLLMVPRMTLFVLGVLRAYQFLGRTDIRYAWRLLQRIERDRKVTLASVPQDIPDPKRREKILIALQLVELVDLDRIGDDFVLRLKDERARLIAQRMVRLRVRRDEPEDDPANPYSP